MDIDDETQETARIPVAALLRAGAALPETETSRPGVSVTQAIRVRRSKRRVVGGLTDTYRVARAGNPISDAAFPTVVSLLFTGPTVVGTWGGGQPLLAVAIALGGASLVFAASYAISRTLDRPLQKPDRPVDFV